MKKLIFSIGVTILSVSMKGQESQTIYNFLRLPVSAHVAALGGDNITIVDDDASLMFSNPALLSSVSDKQIALNYMNYMQGANMLSASFNRVVRQRLSWAASAQAIDYGKMKEMNAEGVQTGEFSAKEISLAGHLSYLLNDRIAGGITAKVVSSYIGDYSSMGICVDLGVNSYDPDRELSLSAVARNLGGQVKAYDEEFEKMPFNLAVGVSKRLDMAPLRLSATMADLTNWDYGFGNHLSVGADFLFSESIWAGLGYNFRRAHEMTIDTGDGEKGSSHGAGWNFGAGINLERFHLNVAYGKFPVSPSSVTINVEYAL